MPGPQTLRLLHRQRVVHLLRTSGPLARADLASQLGLARSTITGIVSELLEDGTLIELQDRIEGPGYRGRPRVLLDCNPHSRRVLGVWLDDRRARIVVADAAGKVAAEGQTPTLDRTPRAVIQSIIRTSEKLIGESTGGPVSAVGVCVPGFIDTPTGVVMESRELGWHKVDLGRSISRAFNVPTAVQDTTQAVTLAEAISGAARETRAAVVLDIGRRVGVGLIFDGRPYSGGSGIAGLVGHIPAYGSQMTCHCGRVGCIDACMSAEAMRLITPLPGPLDDKAGPVERHRATQEAIDEAVDRIAHTAILIEAIIDPEMLILAGQIVEFDEVATALERRINAIRPHERQDRTTIVRSQIGHMNAPGETRESNHRVSIIVALRQLDPDIAGLLRNH